MLLLVSAARFAAHCARSPNAKDVEAGDFFEGNTDAKSRAAPIPSVRTVRILCAALIAAAAFNVLAPNTNVGLILSRVALVISLAIYVAFLLTTRYGDSTSAGTAITGGSGSGGGGNGVQSLSPAFTPACLAVALLMLSAHINRSTLVNSVGADAQERRQASSSVALSKHPFGLEREMAKSAMAKGNRARAAETEHANSPSAAAARTRKVAGDAHAAPSSGAVPRAFGGPHARGSYLDTMPDHPMGPDVPMSAGVLEDAPKRTSHQKSEVPDLRSSRGASRPLDSKSNSTQSEAPESATVESSVDATLEPSTAFEPPVGEDVSAGAAAKKLRDVLKGGGERSVERPPPEEETSAQTAIEEHRKGQSQDHGRAVAAGHRGVEGSAQPGEDRARGPQVEDFSITVVHPPSEQEPAQGGPTREGPSR
jgi:hypothetical protein